MPCRTEVTKKFINAEAETKDVLLYNCISSILLHLHSNCGNKIRVEKTKKVTIIKHVPHMHFAQMNEQTRQMASLESVENVSIFKPLNWFSTGETVELKQAVNLLGKFAAIKLFPLSIGLGFYLIHYNKRFQVNLEIGPS